MGASQCKGLYSTDQLRSAHSWSWDWLIRHNTNIIQTISLSLCSYYNS